MSAEECLNVADADLLGLGVRIGSYLGAFSAIINLRLDADDAPGNAWLQVFTAVPLLVFAFKFILQRLISNAMFIATGYIGWAQLMIMPSVLLMPTIRCYRLLVALIYTGIAWTLGVMLWFWADGYQRMAHCGGTRAFFFANIPAFGWFRYFTLIALGLTAVAYGALLATLASRRLRASAAAWNRPLRLGAALVLGLIFMILGCELTLKWNDVGAVNSLNSTGQMIPLLLGVGAVTRDAYFAWAKTRPCPAPTPYGAAAEDGAGLPTGAMVLPPAAAAVKQV